MPNLTVDLQPEPSVSPQPVSTNPSHYNIPKAILFGILIFVLLAMTAYGAYWYGQRVVTTKTTPSIPSSITSESSQPENSFSDINNQATPTATDETSNWKTYTNKQLGFTIKYPETFYLSVDGSTGIKISNFGLEAAALEDEGWWFDMYVSENKGMISSRARADQFVASVFSSVKEINKVQITSIKVNGYTAARVTGPAELNKPRALLVFLSKGKEFWNFDLMRSESEPSPGYYQKTETIFDQILSTFIFL